MRAAVVPLADVDAAAWQALVDASPAATPFHTLEYAAAVAALGSGRTVFAIVVRDGVGYACGLLASERRFGPARSVSSMAFGGYGGPIVGTGAGTPGDARALAEATIAAARRRAGPLGSLEIVDFAGSLPPMPLRGAHVTPLVTRVLPLDQPYAGLERRFEPTVRQKIRQAERAGLVVRETRDAADVRGFLDLARAAYGKHGGAAPTALFAALLTPATSPAGASRPVARLTLAALPDGRVAGGSLHLRAAGHTINLLTAIDPVHAPARPANLLVADAIRHALREEDRLYNFGLTPPGAPGVEAFKKAWGALPHDYRSLRFGAAIHRVSRRLRGLAR